MKRWGIGLAITGILLAGIALIFDTRAPGSDVYNLGLLQAQAMTFDAGLAIAVAGVVLVAAAEVVRLLGQGHDSTAASIVDGSVARSGVAARPTLTEEERVAAESKAVRDGALMTRLFIAVGVVGAIALLLVLLATQHSAP